jgi:hypothetical protein
MARGGLFLSHCSHHSNCNIWSHEQKHGSEFGVLLTSNWGWVGFTSLRVQWIHWESNDHIPFGTDPCNVHDRFTIYKPSTHAGANLTNITYSTEDTNHSHSYSYTRFVSEHRNDSLRDSQALINSPNEIEKDDILWWDLAIRYSQQRLSTHRIPHLGNLRGLVLSGSIKRTIHFCGSASCPRDIWKGLFRWIRPPFN